MAEALIRYIYEILKLHRFAMLTRYSVLYFEHGIFYNLV